MPSITDGSAVSTGAAIIHAVDGPQVTLIGTGSEVSVALDTAKLLASEGIRCNVVSMPSWDRFAALDVKTQDSILPRSIPRVSIEAGTTFGWATYATHSVGIDRFGASAPGSLVMEKLGISVSHLADVVRKAVQK